MNNQEALNKACEFLMEQGCAAIASNGDCQYLTERGQRCAIGALLTDEQAERAARLNYRAGLVIADDKSVSELLSECSPVFLEELQDAHDAAKEHFEIRFPANVERLADKWALEVPECVKNNS